MSRTMMWSATTIQTMKRATVICGAVLALLLATPGRGMVWAQAFDTINTCPPRGRPCFTVLDRTESKECRRKCRGVKEQAGTVYRECCGFDYRSCPGYDEEEDEEEEDEEEDDDDEEKKKKWKREGKVHCTKFPKCKSELCSPIGSD